MSSPIEDLFCRLPCRQQPAADDDRQAWRSDGGGARKLAIETLGGIVLQKADPLLERKTRRASLTVAGLCDQYMKAADKGLTLGRRKSQPKKASTLEVDRGKIARHIKPLLGNKLVIDLSRADVTKFMRDVAAGNMDMTYNFGERSGEHQ